MAARPHVGVLVGSLRSQAYSSQLAAAICKLAAPTLATTIIDWSSLAIFDQDLEPLPPPSWQAFRAAIRDCAAILFVTPEYNRSIPGGLKNALDVGSRPHGQNVWRGKPAAVVSSSPGKLGGFGANHHLRQVLAYLDMPVLAQPEMYVGEVDGLLGDDGQLEAEQTRTLVATFVDAFAAWIARTADGA